MCDRRSEQGFYALVTTVRQRQDVAAVVVPRLGDLGRVGCLEGADVRTAERYLRARVLAVHADDMPTQACDEQLSRSRSAGRPVLLSQRRRGRTRRSAGGWRTVAWPARPTARHGGGGELGSRPRAACRRLLRCSGRSQLASIAWFIPKVHLDPSGGPDRADFRSLAH